MSVTSKIKDFFKKLGKRTKNAVDANAARADDPNFGASDGRKNKTDAEASLEEVVHEEIYPEKKRCHKSKGRPSAKKRDAEFAAEAPRKKTSKTSNCKKPPSKRTRPTNPNYRMINPDDDTADTGKS